MLNASAPYGVPKNQGVSVPPVESVIIPRARFSSLPDVRYRIDWRDGPPVPVPVIRACAVPPDVFDIDSWLLIVVVPIPTLPAPFTTRAFGPTLRSEEKRFVEDAVVEKKLVVVAEVPVAFTKVKFCIDTVPVAVRLPPIYASPATESLANGDVVPIPTFPVFVTLNLDDPPS